MLSLNAIKRRRFELTACWNASFSVRYSLVCMVFSCTNAICWSDRRRSASSTTCLGQYTQLTFLQLEKLGSSSPSSSCSSSHSSPLRSPIGGSVTGQSYHFPAAILKAIEHMKMWIVQVPNRRECCHCKKHTLATPSQQLVTFNELHRCLSNSECFKLYVCHTAYSE